MRTKSLFAIALAATTLAVSCKKTVPETTQEISFRLAHSPVSVTTKTDKVTSLSSFGVTATTGASGAEVPAWENVTFSGWEIFTGGKWWPETDPGFRFYAANSAISVVRGEAVLQARNTSDVVAAYLPNPAYKTVNNITFQHIFARLRNVSVTVDPGYTLSDVSVSLTPKTGGVFHIASGYGQSDGTGWSDVEDGSAQQLSESTGGNKKLDLYLVPGEYVLTATWTATKGDFSVTHTNKRYVANLVGGKENDLSITLFGEESDDSSVHFRVSLEQWGETEGQAQFTPDVFNGHDYVDLGLRDSEGRKVLFGTMNVGAARVFDYGDRLSWGETQIRYTPIENNTAFTGAVFEWQSYLFSDGLSTRLTKYCTREDYSADGYVDGLSALCDTDDAASVRWGGKWQMPEREHFQLLLNTTLVTATWVENYQNSSISGNLYTGKGAYANASIFLPAAGHFGLNNAYSVNRNGEYWCRTLGSGTPDKAVYMNFSATTYQLGQEGIERYQPRSIRPVIVVAE